MGCSLILFLANKPKQITTEENSDGFALLPVACCPGAIATNDPCCVVA